MFEYIMKFSYDPHYIIIAYIRLRKKQSEIHTIKISEELNVDLAP